MITDVMPWISIPEPEFVITPSPKTLAMKPGQNKTVEIRINLNVNLESNVLLTTEERDDNLESSFKPSKVIIQPNGIGTSYLSVKAVNNPSKHTVTFPIYEMLSFPSKQINYSDADANIGYYLPIQMEEYPLSEQFKDLSVYGDALSLIGGGFIDGFSGFIFAKLEKNKKHNEPKT